MVSNNMPSLNWIGKEAVLNYHREVPYRLLKCEGDLSNGDPGSGNLLIEGDNLEALKALLPYYKGRVKCIYIDPPYNTGNTKTEKWAYDDNVDAPEIRKWLKQIVNSDMLDRHDRWLCMMWPRLLLLKEFLSLDGVILVSIDEHEMHRLRVVMDDIFKERNHLADLVWQKGRKNDAHFVSVGHEYTLLYARSKSTLESLKTRWREAKPGAGEILRKTRALFAEFSDEATVQDALAAWYRSLDKKHPAKKLSRYRHIDNYSDRYGPWRDRDISWPGGGGPRYNVIHPVICEPVEVPERGWIYSDSETMQLQIDRGLVVFREDLSPPFRKAHLLPLPEETESESESFDEIADDAEVGFQVMPSVIERQSQVSVKALRKLLGHQRFNNPKDAELLARYIGLVTEEGDLVLDAFAGSGTTGEAIQILNNKGDRDRSVILIEKDEDYVDSITAERLRRVRLNFRYCTLGETLFSADGTIAGEVTRERLAHHIWFVETGEPLPHRVPQGLTIGYHNNAAVVLVDGPLNVQTLRTLEPHDGPRIVYADSCRLEAERLVEENIIYKAVPYDVRDI